MLIRRAVFLDAYNIVDIINKADITRKLTYRAFISTFGKGLRLVSIENNNISSYIELTECKEPYLLKISAADKTFEISEFVVQERYALDYSNTSSKLLEELLKQPFTGVNIVYVDKGQCALPLAFWENHLFTLIESKENMKIYLFSK